MSNSEFLSMNKLMKLLTDFSNKLHPFGKFKCFTAQFMIILVQQQRILKGIDFEEGSPNLYVTENC